LGINVTAPRRILIIRNIFTEFLEGIFRKKISIKNFDIIINTGAIFERKVPRLVKCIPMETPCLRFQSKIAFWTRALEKNILHWQQKILSFRHS